MDLDEDDLESLGYGAQKAYEARAVDMVYARVYFNRFMREYMAKWRKQHPDKVKEYGKISRERIKADPEKLLKRQSDNKKYWLTDKGKAARIEKNKKYQTNNKDKINKRRRARYKEKKAAKLGSK